MLLHLHLFDGSFQLPDLNLYGLLVGQDIVDLLGDLFLGEEKNLLSLLPTPRSYLCRRRHSP